MQDGRRAHFQLWGGVGGELGFWKTVPGKVHSELELEGWQGVMNGACG